LAWDILEHLLKKLQHSERNDEQLRLVLQALRDSLEADVVFHWYGEVATPAVEVVGPSEATPEWCQALAQKVVQTHGTEQAQLVLPPLALPALENGPSVSSAALVRLGKSAQGWLVALSLDPRHRFSESDLKIILLARRMLLGQREYSQTYAKLKDALFSLIHCLTAMIDARDPYTCGHSERVARIAVRLGKQMGLPGRVQSDLYLAGLLHDIGKIGIRDDVLLKQGKLTPEEFAHMQEHVLIGDRVVTTVKQLASLRDGVRSHHERVDGTGYPDALAGKNIPVLARVLAVADSCDAMMSSRPYRPAMPTQQIDSILAAGAGSQWDAEIIGHFLACRQDLYAICQRGLGRSVLHAVEQVLHQGCELSDTHSMAKPQPQHNQS
jgi:HD-GYP domain-containing protein (c-di-GMP phosphodiesterase class II)